MAEIFSKRLKVSFDCEVMQVKDDDGTVKNVPTHAGMEDILDNQMTPDIRPAVDYEEVHVPQDIYPAFDCIISDGNISIRRYGSAPAETLSTKIEKRDPVATARKRAFDKAMRAYLQLEEKSFSKEELSGPKPIITEDEPEVYEEAPISTGEFDDEGQTSQPESSSCGDVVVNIGKYAGKNMTVSQIYDTEVGTDKKSNNWYYYILDNMTSAKFKEVTDAMKEYRKLREG